MNKISKVTKSANLPVGQPTKFALVINLQAAKQIGLTISPNVLARADRQVTSCIEHGAESKELRENLVKMIMDRTPMRRLDV